MSMQSRYVFLALLSGLLLTSCISKKELVQAAYQHDRMRAEKTFKESKHITIELDVDSAIVGPIQCHRQRNLVLPLLVINSWNVQKATVLPDDNFYREFKRYTHQYNTSNNLYKKLGNKDVEVILTNVPNVYYTKNKGYYIWPFFVGGSLNILTDDFELEAEINIYENDILVDSTVYSYNVPMDPYPFDPVVHRFSKKRWVGDYLSWRDGRIAYLAHSMCRLLIEEYSDQ